MKMHADEIRLDFVFAAENEEVVSVAWYSEKKKTVLVLFPGFERISNKSITLMNGFRDKYSANKTVMNFCRQF